VRISALAEDHPHIAELDCKRDPGLTALGRAQAARTANWFRSTGVDAIYSSPLRRATETAQAIATATNLKVQWDVRLRERMNWDGTQSFAAFLADWARTERDRDFVPGRQRLRFVAPGRRAAAGVSARGRRGTRRDCRGDSRRGHLRPAADTPR